MRTLWTFLIAISILFTAEAFAQVVPSPTPSATPSIAVSPKAQTPVIVDVVKASPAPVTPAAPMSLDSGSSVQPVVIQDVDMAPPTWMQNAFVTIKALPIVGPIVTKALQWLAVITSILTALCACVLLVLKSVAGIAAFSQLTELSDTITKFQNGKVMYWLRYASLFNAPKTVAVATPAPTTMDTPPPPAAA